MLFLPVTLIPLLVVGLAEYFNAKDSLTKNTQREISGVHTQISQEISHYYNSVLNNLFSHASTALNYLQIKNSNNKNNNQTIKNMFSEVLRYYDYSQILIIDNQGNIQFSEGSHSFSTANILNTSSLAKTPLAKGVMQALQKGEWLYTPEYDYSVTSGKPTSPTGYFILPLEEKQVIYGVLAIGTSADKHLQSLINKITKPTVHLNTYLIDHNNQMLFSSKKLSDKKNALAFPDNWSDILQVSQISQYINTFDEEVVGIAQPVNIGKKSAFLITEMLVNEAYASVLRFKNFVFFTIMAVLFISVISALFLALYISKPLKKMSRQAKEIAKGNYHKTELVTYNDEIGELSQSFTIMAERLHENSIAHEEQTWLYKSLIEFNHILRKESKLNHLTQTVLNWLCDKVKINAAQLRFVGAGSGDQKIIVTQTSEFASVSHSSQINRNYKLPLLFGGKTIGQLILKTRKQLTCLHEQLISLILEPLTTCLCNLRFHIQIEKSSNYKSIFLANLSHELRTPIHSILSLSESLADYPHTMSAQQLQRSVLTINQVGKELLFLINDALDLSKVEAGELSIVNTSCSLTEITEMLNMQFSALAKKKNIQFSVSNMTQLSHIKTDKHRLIQILQNLLSNTIKFTSKGYVSLCIKHHSTDSIAFYIEDSSTGISQEKHAALFNVFNQDDVSDSGKNQETGLGLSICRKLAKLLGGEIIGTRAPGKESHVSFIIPVQAKQNSTHQYSQARPSKTNLTSNQITSTQLTDKIITKLNNKCILIVGQDLRQSFHLSGLLESLGVHVKLANNRELVKEKLSQKPAINAVLVEEKCIGVLDIIAKNKSQNKFTVVLLSKNHSEEKAKELNSHVDSIAYMPCTLQTLMERVLFPVYPQDYSKTQK